MKVLVTGGAGFIGRHLISVLLKEGHSVRCLTHSNSAIDLQAQGVEIVKGDITDPDSIRNIADSIDVVYHLASSGHVGANTDAAYKEFRHVNVIGLRNLIDEVVERSRISRLVHFSSTAAMGLIEGEANEESVCRPQTPYQRTKYEAEEILRRKFHRDGLPVVILRPSMVYGPGDRNQEFLAMCKMVKKGRFPLSSTSEGLTPLVHVDDVAQAAMLAKTRGREGQTYIITADRSYSIHELIDVIASTLGVSRGGIEIPNWTMEVAAVVCEIGSKAFGSQPALTRRRLKSILADRSFDISKAVKELGYAPRTSLRDGVADVISWYKSQGRL
ncbi:MAG: NAD-dependent epimerase/dehydratase family protein [Armatimonadota bacterium]|nr:NAD-dependent epimerase/dehydratase family protein [Armatimonadota bacterium]